jgi:hypothetical protein
VNRTAAYSYLQDEYALLAGEAAWAQGEESTAYSNAIDHALRALGFAEGDLGTVQITSSAQILSFYALLDYYALMRYAKTFALRTDIQVQGAVQVKQSQTYAQVRSLLHDAERRCIQLGVGPVQQVTIVRYNLDMFEPDLTFGEV